MDPDSTTQEGQEGTQATEVTTEEMREAGSLGWVPKERFKGREEEWVDAKEFLRRGQEILPIVKANNRKLTERVENLERKLTEARNVASEAMEYGRKAAEAEWKEKYEDLKRAHAKAVTDGEGEAATALAEELAVHREAKPKAGENKPANAESSDPRFDQWKSENAEWYGVDKELTAMANSVGAALAQQYKGDRLYEEVDKRMRKLYPEKFDEFDEADVEARRNRGVGGASRSTRASAVRPSGNARTFEALPEDAKQQFDRFFKNGTYRKLNKADAQKRYIADYPWE